MPSRYVTTAAPIDPSDGRITAHMGFLYSRIPAGGIPLVDLYHLSMLEPQLTDGLVRQMVEIGLLQMNEPSADIPSGRPSRAVPRQAGNPAEPQTERRQQTPESSRQEDAGETARPKTVPPAEPGAKARSLFEAGLADEQAQNWLSAANNFKLAMTYEPASELYAEKYRQVYDKARAIKARGIFKKARFSEMIGDIEKAVGHYRMAADVDPRNAEICAGAAAALHKQGELADAAVYARRAVKAGPQLIENRLLLARILLAIDQPGEARNHLEYVLQRDRDNVEAKALLKGSRSLFGR